MCTLEFTPHRWIGLQKGKWNRYAERQETVGHCAKWGRSLHLWFSVLVPMGSCSSFLSSDHSWVDFFYSYFLSLQPPIFTASTLFPPTTAEQTNDYLLIPNHILCFSAFVPICALSSAWNPEPSFKPRLKYHLFHEAFPMSNWVNFSLLWTLVILHMLILWHFFSSVS